MNSPDGPGREPSFGADGSHDQHSAALSAVMCPDDISELDAEVRRYHREVRRARRRARLGAALRAPFAALNRGAHRMARALRFFHPW